MKKYIKYRTIHELGFIRLNRPEVYNALIPEMIEELIEVFSEFEIDNSIRAIVLDGEGKSFCAGADINWMKSSAENELEQNQKDSRVLAELFYKIHSLNKPVIASVHGPVYGGGLGLMAACDIVVADKKARFKFSEVRLGITPSTIMPYITYRMGKQQAKVKVLTAELFDSKEAYRIQLVDFVVKEDSYHYAINIAGDILKGSPEANAETKHLLYSFGEEFDVESVKERSIESLVKIKQTANAKEGFSAFLQKREPKWK